jgi:hypothetical protein
VSEVVADLINKEYNAISAQMDAAEQAEEEEFLHEQGLVTPTERARADQFALEEEVMYGDKPATILSIDKNDGTARISVEGGEENMRVKLSDLQKMEATPEVEAAEEAEVVETPTETPTEQTTQEVATPKVEAVLNEAGEVDVVSTGEEQTANYLAQEFETPEDAFKQAISMTCQKIMECKTIISVVPYAVKAKAIHDTLTSELSNMVPATLMKQHADVTVYCDADSAALVPQEVLESFK